jgi:hypothetical protein
MVVIVVVVIVVVVIVVVVEVDATGGSAFEAFKNVCVIVGK